MATKSYIEENRGYITSTKLKAFDKCPMFYDLVYNKELLIEEPSDSLIMGRSFDDYMTLGKEGWEKKWAILEPRQKRTGFKGKQIPMTNSTGSIILAAVEEAMRQPIFDAENGYEKQVTIYAVYKAANGEKLKLKGTLDRLSLAKKLIRDWKLFQSIEKFEREYSFGDPYGYSFQSAFYQLLVLIDKDTLCEFVFDVVENNLDPHSDAFKPNMEVLQQERARIISLLDQIAECQKSGKWRAIATDERVGKCTKCDMYRKCQGTAIKREFTYL